MRVSQGSTYLSFLRDLHIAQERSARAQSVVSSGKKVLRPSDSPEASSDILRISAHTAEAVQFGKNLSIASSRLDAADRILANVENVVERVRNLGLLSVSHPDSAKLYSEEVSGLRDQLLAAANAQHQGTYIFGGSALTTPPFQEGSDSTVTYQGNSTVMTMQVSRTVKLQSQIPGDEIFTGTVDVFSTIDDLLTAMQAGDFTGLDAQVKNLEAYTEVLSAMRSRLGSTINVASSLESEAAAAGLSRAKQLDDAQSADMAHAISEMTQSQTGLQATLAVGARLSQLSLLDYLR